MWRIAEGIAEVSSPRESSQRALQRRALRGASKIWASGRRRGGPCGGRQVGGRLGARLGQNQACISQYILPKAHDRGDGRTRGLQRPYDRILENTSTKNNSGHTKGVDTKK